MADAALALARRILAGDGGATQAATALRDAIASDGAAASDSRPWAALAYLLQQTGDFEGARLARAEIDRLRPSKRASLPPILPSYPTSRAARSLKQDLDAAAPTRPTLARSARLADAKARMAKLRTEADTLFATRRERPLVRADVRAPLMRRMRVLRAQGGAIMAAVEAEKKVGEVYSDEFMTAAALCDDDGGWGAVSAELMEALGAFPAGNTTDGLRDDTSLS